MSGTVYMDDGKVNEFLSKIYETASFLVQENEIAIFPMIFRRHFSGILPKI